MSPHLERGRSLLVQVPAGTRLHVQDGRVRLAEAPRWLSECLPSSVQRLGAGDVFVAERRMWLRLEAQAAADLHWQLPAPAQPLWAPWSAWVARLQALAAAGLGWPGRLRNSRPR